MKDAYLVATDSWSDEPSPKTLLSRGSAIDVDRWIVMTGGEAKCFDDHNNFDYMNTRTFVYDTLTQQWIENNISLSPPRFGDCCFRIGSQIISIGGQDGYENYCAIDAIQIKYLIPDWSWPIIKDFVSLRQLIDKDRAVLLPRT